MSQKNRQGFSTRAIHAGQRTLFEYPMTLPPTASSGTSSNESPAESPSPSPLLFR